MRTFSTSLSVAPPTLHARKRRKVSAFMGPDGRRHIIMAIITIM